MDTETQENLTEENLDAVLNSVFGNSSSSGEELNKPSDSKRERAQNNFRLALNANGLSSSDIARTLANVAKNSEKDSTRLVALELAMNAQGLLAKEIESGVKIAPVVNITINPFSPSAQIRNTLDLFIPQGV